jgi:hypothetical protein
MITISPDAAAMAAGAQADLALAGKTVQETRGAASPY